MDSTMLGVQLGPLIPVERYDRISKAIWAQFPTDSDVPSSHALTSQIGWIGLGYRARSAAEHADAFKLLFDLEPAATQEQRYQQDDHFFGFVTNATAAAENLVYAVHVIALGIAGTDLTDQLLARHCKVMLKTISGVGRLAALGDLLEKSLVEAGTLFDMRDTLLHRGRPSRNHFVGGKFHRKITVASNPKATSDKWTNDFEFNSKSCDPFAKWLRDLIHGSIVGLEKVLPIA